MSPAGALAGRRILLTRSAEGNAAWARRLEERGLAPATLDCIRTETIRDARAALGRELDACDWLVLASARGARAVAELAPDPLPPIEVAVVGPATALEATERLHRPSRIAPEGTGRSLGVELAATLPRSARVLVAAAAGGRTDVEDVLTPVGIEVRRVEVYRTVPAAERRPRIRLDRLGVEAVLLASPSAVTGLLRQAELGPDVAVAALGPTTAAAARDAGLPVHAEARGRTLDDLLDALAAHLGGAG